MNWLWKLLRTLFPPTPPPEPTPPPAPVPPPQPEPTPPPAPSDLRVPKGHFALQPGDVNRPLPTKLLQLPGVDGETIRIRWHEIQPSQGVFKWGWLDQQINRCESLGLPYKILVMTGAGGVPNWAYDLRVPWDKTLAANYRKFVGMLGDKYSREPLCVGVHVTGPTYMASAEMHAKGDGRNVVNEPGYSADKMIEAWMSAIDAYADAFPNVTCCLSISGQNDALPYVRPVIAYAKQRLGKRAAFQHNALAAKTSVTASHHKLVAELGADGWTVGYEMLCPTADSQRFGSARLSDGLDKSAPQTSWWDIYPGDLEQLK